jgi:uncharacterized protein
LSYFALLLALAAGGCVASALNIVAGGGSFLTLPMLIFFGLPPTVANGTNRVGVLVQNLGGVWGFQRHGLLDWRWGLWAAAPAALGAVAGTGAALVVGDAAFRKILASLMVAVTLWTLLDPLRRGRRPALDGPGRARGVGVGLAFLAVGVYAGFVQAGVGFLILAVTTMAGLDLVRGNAVKVLTILVSTVLSLGIFAWSGRVDWPAGLALAAGSAVGSQIGVRLTVLKGHRWVRGVVTAAVAVFAVLLWASP